MRCLRDRCNLLSQDTGLASIAVKRRHMGYKPITLRECRMSFSKVRTLNPVPERRRSLRRYAWTCAALAMVVSLGACTNPYDPGQRALGGAAIGAGTGAAIGALASGGRGAATGALIGGAIGAVGGAVTTPPPPANGYAYPPPAPTGYYPNMVWLPSPGVYVAMDYSYPLFFYSGISYYLYSDRWYSGPNYNGPWRPHAAPPPLSHFRAEHWNTYQSRARSYYRGNPNWRHFQPH